MAVSGMTRSRGTQMVFDDGYSSTCGHFKLQNLLEVLVLRIPIDGERLVVVLRVLDGRQPWPSCPGASAQATAHPS